MKRRRIAPILAAALLLGFAQTQARALDTITRNDGQNPVSGEISAVSKTQITIKVGLKKEEQNVPANVVQRVRFDGEPPALFSGRNYEAAGRYSEAVEKYEEALGDNPSEFPKTDLEFLIARATARIALSDASKRNEAIEKLDGFSKSNANSFRFYPALTMLGEVYLAQGDFSKAQTTFSLLEQAPWSDYKMAAKTANARLFLKQNKIAEARAAFSEVVGMPANTPAEKARRFDAMLGKAVCLQRENQHEQAVKALVDITNQAPANEKRLQAEAYLRQGDSYRLLGQTKAAILAYLHVDVLFSSESALHAESLYWLSQLWNAAGHPDRSARSSTKLESQYPDSEWARKLAAAGGG